MSQQKKSPYRSRGKYQKKTNKSSPYFIFGTHSVVAAVQNKKRVIHELMMTDSAALRFKDKTKLLPNNISEKIVIKSFDYMNNIHQSEHPHQGIILHTEPLAQPELEDIFPLLNVDSNRIVVLDQITDPHNVGAILRSAAAFGAKAILLPKDNSPQESAIMVKASSGAIESIPLIKVTNLARAIETLKQWHFWCLGLDGHTSSELSDCKNHDNIALIMGSEGKGLRRLTREKCDLLVKIPIHEQMESLNVSNAAAIALYEISRKQGKTS